jgi:endonuclease/exonuclease/phosphatase family metal-dependent hydrolase
MKIRIVTWNIHKGFSPLNSTFTLDAIRSLIRSTGAEVVLLQEVQGEHTKKKSTYKDWPKSNQFEYLADEVWPHFAYGKNAFYPEGHHGNAILSRYPIARWDNLDLSLHRFERRETKVDFDLYCTHLNLRAGDRRKQAELILKAIEERSGRDRPLILGGDFNDWRNELHPVFRTVGVSDAYWVKRGAIARTFPSIAPFLALDRIYTRGFSIRSVSRIDPQHGTSLGSDHLAILADLHLPESLS